MTQQRTGPLPVLATHRERREAIRRFVDRGGGLDLGLEASPEAVEALTTHDLDDASDYTAAELFAALQYVEVVGVVAALSCCRLVCL